MARGLKRAALVGFVASACGGVHEELTVTFPDESAQRATKSLAVTVFEPLLSDEGGTQRFVSCEEATVFPPLVAVDLDEIADARNLGRVVLNRAPRSYPLRDDWNLSFPKIEGSSSNPWGALMIVVEARGDVQTPEGEVRDRTLLKACHCIRTEAGSSSDDALNAVVEEACADVTREGAAVSREREFTLEPLLPSDGFDLERCEVPNAAALVGATIFPPPSTCLGVAVCGGTSTTDCFPCAQPCSRIDNRANVPVQYAIVRPDGTVEPRSVVVTDDRGAAYGGLTVRAEDCATGTRIRAHVVGRLDAPVDFDVNCLAEAVFSTGRVVWSGAASSRPLFPVGLAALRRGVGVGDQIVVLSEVQTPSLSETSARLDLVDPTRPGTGDHAPAPIETIELENERAKMAHGFSFEVGTDGQPVARPAVAVATTDAVPVGSTYALRIRALELRSGRLCPQDCPGCGTSGQSYAQCAEQDRSGLLEEQCSIRKEDDAIEIVTLKTELASLVSFRTSDLDGDGLSDLAVGTNFDTPIFAYVASRASARFLEGVLFDGQEAVTCGRYAQRPDSFELVRLGGPLDLPAPGAVHLVVGTATGLFVRYATEVEGRVEIRSGGSDKIGGLIPIIDLGRGRFRCGEVGHGCAVYEDAVVIASQAFVASGVRDTSGEAQVLFGDKASLAGDEAFRRMGRTFRLRPRSRDGRVARQPKIGAVGDVNADGHHDVVIAFARGGGPSGSAPAVGVWLGSGRGALVELSVDIVPDGCSAITSVALLDVNADARDDIAVLCRGTGGGFLQIFESQPSSGG